MDCSLYWWADCNVEREMRGDLLKKKDHQDLTDEIRSKGWVDLVIPVGVGRGVFPAQSNWSNTRRTGTQKLSTSIWVWRKSLQKNWKSSTDWRWLGQSLLTHHLEGVETTEDGWRLCIHQLFHLVSCFHIDTHRPVVKHSSHVSNWNFNLNMYFVALTVPMLCIK